MTLAHVLSSPPPGHPPFSTQVVAAVRSPSVWGCLRELFPLASVAACWDADAMRRALSTQRTHLVVYEVGVWPTPLAVEFLGTLRVSGGEVPIVISWGGNTDATAELVRFVAGIPTAVPAHEPHTLKYELLRQLIDGPTPTVAGTAIRHLRAASGTDALDPYATAAVLLSRSRISVEEFARAISVSSRSVSRRCRESNLPRPVALLGWSRALHVVAALEGGDESLQQIALAGGEATARECSDYVRYHTRFAPSRWLSVGGFTRLLAEFSSQVLHHPVPGPPRTSSAHAYVQPS